jgi:hypothetical protein
MEAISQADALTFVFSSWGRSIAAPHVRTMIAAFVP